MRRSGGKVPMNPLISQSPAKGGQIVVHQAAAARTIVAVTFSLIFIIFVCCAVVLLCCMYVHAVHAKLYTLLLLLFGLLLWSCGDHSTVALPYCHC